MHYWFLPFAFQSGQGLQLTALPQLQSEYQILSALHVNRLKSSINPLTWCKRDKESVMKENLGGFFLFVSFTDWPGHWNISETISHQKIKHLVRPDLLHLSCIHWKIWISVQSGNNTCCNYIFNDCVASVQAFSLSSTHFPFIRHKHTHELVQHDLVKHTICLHTNKATI